MTFSQTVKEEIINGVFSARACCQTAFLKAVLGGGGCFELSQNRLCPVLTTRDERLANLCAEISQKRFDLGCDFVKEQKGKNSKYVLTFSPLLTDKLAISPQTGLFDDVAFSDCCRASFVKGLFCAFGSLVVPTHSEDLADSAPSSSYHLEIALTRDSWRDEVEKLLTTFASFKLAERKDSNVFYLKDAEQIGDFLVCVGAVSAKLTLENILVERSVRNNANRQANCISANIDKAVAAAEKQIAAIGKLKKSGKFFSLSEELKETAEARLTNPDATLAELAEKLNVTKNCINKRLCKLQELSQQ